VVVDRVAQLRLMIVRADHVETSTAKMTKMCRLTPDLAPSERCFTLREVGDRSREAGDG